MKIQTSTGLRSGDRFGDTSLQKGFASILTVVTVSVGLLLILITMYNDTVESQGTQKDHMLRADYQQREEAFLRALTNIVPNKAMICMQDNSYNWSTRQTMTWDTIFSEALTLSNTNAPLDTTKIADLNIPTARNGNTANTTFSVNDVISNLSGNRGFFYSQVTAGTNYTATTDYPPPLECSFWHHSMNGRYPIVSYEKKYGSSADGWVGADYSQYPQYNIVDAPSMHFNYQNSASMIAKHNWWGFTVSFADQSDTVTKIATREKKYMISLYEIPSQLPINGATYTAMGAHTDGTEWANFHISGGIFAQRVKTEGSFSTEAISSRKGVELSGNTTVNGSTTGTSAGSDPFASNARELSETKGETFPISSASNGGRVSFVPINRGLEFYDRFHGNGSTSTSSNAISPTSWDYYSIGAKQCRMRLDIIGVTSATDQTPTSIRFSYWADVPNDGYGGYMVTETFTKGSNWPDVGSDEGQTFPFHVQNSATGYPCVAIYLERLAAYLATKNADHFDINNSLSVNPDYVNNLNISQPSFPTSAGDLGLMLLDSKDLTAYTSGFSMVTNMRLIIADDVNVTATTAPADMTMASGELFYPPLSLFAPEKRYGDSATPMKIEVDGQLGSLAKGNTDAVHIGDFKSGMSDQVVPTNISADLKAISHPAALPPINIMNWMVVVREIHPTYIPESDEEEE
ncbi:hypothetical protein NT6N_35520 [Oceaniferula spumae]|uniref:Uncharacterized protein n=1 Tax=Oceaniferula spumae TaxID=2979115 RepID=A0AAT9FQT8_9BACT